LPHQRDGPASQATTAGPQEPTANCFLPRPRLPRKAFPPAPNSPKPYIPRASPRRQHSARWHVFSVRLYAEPGVDGVRALHALLKFARRRFGLRAFDVRELDPPA
jgi:hypothetical protein